MTARETATERAIYADMELREQAKRHAEERARERSLGIHEHVKEIMITVESRLADERRAADEEMRGREERQYLTDLAIRNNARADLLRSRIEVRRSLAAAEKRVK